ncbi:MAG: hypothetical protein JSV21_07525 [Nitrospirota bacterium]|nr:MAG: hypothetical protein JSV21_07525 [Nitrospirota bacterium]
MKELYLDVSQDICLECALALRKFIGKMDGVESIGVEKGKVVISFDDEKIEEGFLRKVTKDSIDKLGYSFQG